jgi:hypothetical protein
MSSHFILDKLHARRRYINLTTIARHCLLCLFPRLIVEPGLTNPASSGNHPEPSARTLAYAPSIAWPPPHSQDSRRSAPLACSSRRSRFFLRSGLATNVRMRVRSGLGRLPGGVESRCRPDRLGILCHVSHCPHTSLSMCLKHQFACFARLC